MSYLRLQDLLRPTTPPRTANFLDQFYQKFDSGIAAHKKILNVEPLYFVGVVAATEFLVYVNTKLYLAYQLSVVRNTTSAAESYYNIWDENNAASWYGENSGGFYDTGGAAKYFFASNLVIEDIYFSRVDVHNFELIFFNGYRVTLN